MKNNNKKFEISNEAFLRALIDSVTTTAEQGIFELQSIIDDELKRPILKRDYKTILECKIEIRKCKSKKKSRLDASAAHISEIILNSYFKGSM